MELKDTIVIRGIIETVTGLHIGAGKDTIEIGGLDLPVIKNPHNEQPYIPGSSLKGKMRFLTEWRMPGAIKGSDVHSCPDKNCAICRVFGAGRAGDNLGDRGPSRLIMRDADLAEPDSFSPEKSLEVKYENTIDRMTGTAKNPRPMERVVPGTQFNFEMSFRVLDIDSDGGSRDMECFGEFVKVLVMLENDTLGGSGSRGSGKVVFKNLKVDSQTQSGEYRTAAELVDAFKGA